MALSLTRKKDADAAPRAPRRPRREGPPRNMGNDGKAGKGKGRFVLILGDDGGILVYMQGSTVVRRLFAPSAQPDHTASIVELMRSQPNVPLYILADVMDQQYVRHSFPPVSSLSVAGLVNRRMDRDFQAEDLKGALPLGRDKTGRKEWNYLLISLANTPLMQQWVELVVELPNELKGIYLVPVEVQTYLPTLRKHLGGAAAATWQLLVTHNKVSGFRQVVLKDGKLVFTRVTQAIDDGVAAVIAGNIEQEILNTLEYLRRLGFTDPSQIDLYVVTAQEVKETLDVQRFRAGAAHVMTPLDLADMLGLQQAALSADRFGDVVMAAWFGLAKKRILKFQTAYAQKLEKLYTAKRGAMVLGALGALALLALSVSNVVNYFGDNAAARDVDSQRTPVQNEIRNVQKTIDGLDKSVAFKAAVVSTHDVFVAKALSPLYFAGELSRSLSREQRVTDIKWEAIPDQASGNPAASSKAEVKIEFVGSYSDVDTLTKAVDSFVAKLKAEMLDYDIVVADYAWLAAAKDSLEINFSPTAALNPITQGAATIDVTFTGPKPKADNPATDPGMMQ